jgi:MoxR-like ATPase
MTAIPMTAATFAPDLCTDYHLAQVDSWPKSVHRFDDDSVWAVRTALASGRPLLVRGEPGIGKSQLARAVASYFGVPFLSFVVNARSECSDLLYSHDAVSRLAQAQVLSHANAAENWRAELAEERYVRPGKLWWAVNWTDAVAQAKLWCRSCGQDADSDCCTSCGEPEHSRLPDWGHGGGCVLLIDEIDKADSDFPNGLLESLGNTGFEVESARRSVQPEGVPPLVVVTTNEERELPAAFLRRCLVLAMVFPDEDQQQFLADRGHIHFPDLGAAVCTRAADLVLGERGKQSAALSRPGTAEFLDILRALHTLYGRDMAAQLGAIDQVSRFSLRKNPQALRR